jgi:hypothetical protein
MKLSKAIRLGSTILTPQAGGQHFPETQSGCALGMAAIARGCTFRPVPGPIASTERRTLGAEGVWGEWILRPIPRPCYCWWVRVPRKMRVKDIIAHLFDYHVMFKRDWTLERLVAWVETVEPKSSAPVRVVPPNLPSPEALRILAQIREVGQGFSGGDPGLEYHEDPEIWRARVTAYLAHHAKQKAARRSAEMDLERLSDASEASAAGRKNAYQPWMPTRGNSDGNSGAPAPAVVYRP